MAQYIKTHESGVIDDGWVVSAVADGEVLAHLQTEGLADAVMRHLMWPQKPPKVFTTGRVYGLRNPKE